LILQQSICQSNSTTFYMIDQTLSFKINRSLFIYLDLNCSKLSFNVHTF
jgi:hypothetical protein